MSDSTSNLDQLSTSSANIPTRLNESFDAASVATLFGRRAGTTTGLTWGYYGGVVFIGGARSLIANGTLALTANTTNYVEVDQTGALSINTTSATPSKLLLYTIVTGASTVTSYTDARSKIALAAFFFLYVAVAMANADKTMTQAQDLCATVECTGANTADRNLITAVSRGRFVIYNNTTGGFNIIVKTAAGTGVTVAPGVRALVEVDGVNVNLVANSAGAYTLPIAAAGTLGGVKVGAGLAVAGDGTLSASASAPATQSLTDFANAPGTTTGLTYGYQAGVIRSDSVTTAVAAGTVALTASTTNYVEITGAGVVSANIVGFTSGRYPLCAVLTGSGTITTITDKRGALSVGGGFTGGTLTSALNEAPTVTIASAATVNIGAAAGNSISVTGTTAITAFDTIALGAIRRIVFAGALTLTHNATSLVLPGAANITTAANDVAEFLSLGSGNWLCTGYQKASGSAVVGGGGGLTNFTDGLSTAAPNATVPVASLMATNAATNVDAALSSKGSGATLAQISDSTTAGGNKRGTYATDWQKTRISATQVSSGSYSSIGGGYSNLSGGSYSAIGGGSLNQALSTYDTVAGGSANKASGGTSTVGGGTSNNATGANSFVGGGSSNSAGGTNAVVGGGSTNVVSGNYSCVPGGANCSASGLYSFVSGYQAQDRGCYGVRAAASGMFSAVGDAQTRSFVLRQITTSATPTRLSADQGAVSISNQINVNSGSCCAVRGQIVARNTSGGDCAKWDVSLLVKNVGGTVTIVGSPSVAPAFGDTSASAWAITIAGDSTYGVLALSVTGAASTTIHWVAELTTAEVF